MKSINKYRSVIYRIISKYRSVIYRIISRYLSVIYQAVSSYLQPINNYLSVVNQPTRSNNILPNELLLEIMKLLDLHDILQFSATCYQLRKLFNNNKMILTQYSTRITIEDTYMSKYTELILYPKIGKYKHGAFIDKGLEYYILGKKSESFGNYTGDQYIAYYFRGISFLDRYVYYKGKLIMHIHFGIVKESFSIHPYDDIVIDIMIYKNDKPIEYWTYTGKIWTYQDIANKLNSFKVDTKLVPKNITDIETISRTILVELGNGIFFIYYL